MSKEKTDKKILLDFTQPPKERPVRVYYDKNKKFFYINKGKQKIPINLPGDIKTLSKAQDYVGRKIKGKMRLKPLPDRFYHEVPLEKAPKPLLREIHKEILEKGASTKYPNLTPEEKQEAKRQYDQYLVDQEKYNEEKKAREELLRESKRAADILEKEQKDKDAERESRLAMQRAIYQQDMKRLEGPQQEREPLILEMPTSTPVPSRGPDEKDFDLGPVITELPATRPPGYHVHHLPAANERRKQQARKDAFELKVIKNNEFKSKNINFGDFMQFDQWNGPKSDDVYLDNYYKVAQYLVDPRNKPTVKKDFPPGPGSDFGIQNRDHTEERTKRILAVLTPQRYNELIESKRLPAEFRPIPNPDYLQSGYGQSGGGKYLPALYDDEIDEFFEEDPQFGGVISSDEIDKLPNKLPMGFIMNLDKREDPGSHWVGVYMDGSSIEYFDPLANPPSKDFITRMKKKIADMNIPVMQKLKINKIAQQHGGSFRCGYHSIRFLDDRMNGLDFPLASRFDPDKKINNSKEGEAIIKEEFDYI